MRPTNDLSRQAAAAEDPKATPVPAYVRKRVDRAARATRPFEPVWDECLSFFDGDQYVERSAVTGALQRVETRDGGTAKPRYRSRLVRNRYTPAITSELSAMVSRVPVPECSAPSGNPEAINAARYAEKAALGAYGKLSMRTLVLDVGTYALNCGAGYVWPFWDGGVGEFIEDPVSGETLRTGEIGFWRLSPKQVLWEPGVQLKDSRWVCVRQAIPLDELLER